ncbi:MAG TPA: DNA polymerase III subunit gamma/tau, partial [Solirubrobacteraceae bacterium]|nr:DNA polymerase III subunit gamma/tau [Solirubrobacteraceae bacterium]
MAARLDEQRAEDEQQVGQVDIGAHAVGEHGYAREQDQRGESAGGSPEPIGAEPVDDPAARGQREEAEGDGDVLDAARPEWVEHHPEQLEQRMRRGRDGYAVGRRGAAGELPTPGKRIEGVVVGERDAADEAQQDGDGDDGGQRAKAPEGGDHGGGRYPLDGACETAGRALAAGPARMARRRAGVGRLRRTVPAEQHTQDEQSPQPPQQLRSLYRRHRPRTFAEVVGQEPVVRTLRNAVERGKVHHAYLFVGSRGTGKTSMAKILAACLNCERGPTVEPCGECDSCVSIARASSLDVIEMDAASNNSVDDIRELRESVAYAPVSGRRKVYILDEAHMLSTAAWNAFLKTLEEPPPNTVFVLATTEANKVPATVVDRCHRFDFHRPTVEQIASVVRRVAQAESIEIPPEAVAALARSATGSFRDALGTLEQLVTYSGPQIALEDVLAVLGVADSRLLEETVDALAAGDSRRALLVLEQCAEQGRDAASFASDLEVRARELLVVQTLGEVPAELALTAEADAALAAQAGRVDQATVVRLLELLAEAMEAVRAGADARTRLELALVKAARPEVDGTLRALLARIERLERGAGGAQAAPV